MANQTGKVILIDQLVEVENKPFEFTFTAGLKTPGDPLSLFVHIDLRRHGSVFESFTLDRFNPRVSIFNKDFPHGLHVKSLRFNGKESGTPQSPFVEWRVIGDFCIGSVCRSIDRIFLRQPLGSSRRQHGKLIKK